MALTNKNGLTPGQVTLQKEILDRFGALEAQNTELKAQHAVLENHIAELKEALQKFQKESTRSQAHNVKELQADIHRTNDNVFYFGQEIRDKVEELQSLIKPLLFALLALLFLNVCLTYMTLKSSHQTRDGVYTINELLCGDTSFWYDADNHQLYVRNRNDTD